MRRLSSRQVAASSMSGLATGYLWRTVSVQRSLIASLVTCRIFPTSDDDKSRQNCQIRREIRKKIFATTFFRTEICPCLSLLIFSRWLFFSQSAWHYMCHVTYDPVSTNEIADATRGAQTHCAVKPPYCFCVWERLSRIIYSQLDYATVCEWISFKFWSIDEKYMGNEMYLFFRV